MSHSSGELHTTIVDPEPEPRSVSAASNGSGQAAPTMSRHNSVEGSGTPRQRSRAGTLAPKSSSGVLARVDSGLGLRNRPRTTDPLGNSPQNASFGRSESVGRSARSRSPGQDGATLSVETKAAITQFRVFGRVRPFIPEELRDIPEGTPLHSVVEMHNTTTYILDPKENYHPQKGFDFDGSLWSIPPDRPVAATFNDIKHDTWYTQEDVYNLVAKGAVPDAINSCNTCIMTYGQTGSGKTFSMMGDGYKSVGSDENHGIIPRVCHEMFEAVADLRVAELDKDAKERIEYVVEVTFVEVYMEKVRDLLEAGKSSGGSMRKRSSTIASSRSQTGGFDPMDGLMKEAKVRLHPVSGPYVEDVTKYVVESWDECCSLLERGSKQRTTCSNLVHNQSSRSHAIFQLTLLQQHTTPAKDKYSRPSVKSRAGRINLVDLAGSERGGMTDYVKESAMINKSLLALRRVIDSLVQRQSILLEQAHDEIQGKEVQERSMPAVPYRDSVLTWLLSDSIGGNAKTTMLATLSPNPAHFADTLATLQWSHKARALVTVVKRNDVTREVADGLSSRVSEMHAALNSQKQNVDSVREELHRRQAAIEAAEAASAQRLKRFATLQERTVSTVNATAALRIVWFVRRWKLRRRIREAEERVRQAEAKLQQTKADNDEQSRALVELAAKKKDADASTAAMGAEATELRREMGGDLSRDAVAADKAKLSEKKATLQKSADSLEHDIRDLNADHDALQKAIADMQEKIREVAKKREESAARHEHLMAETRAAMEDQAEEQQQRRPVLQQKAAEIDGRLDALRSQKAELQAKREELLPRWLKTQKKKK